MRPKHLLGKEVFSRGDLIKLESLVASAEGFKAIDKQLACAQRKWLAVCEKSEEDLDKEKDKFSPSVFEPMLDQFGDEQDKLENQFLKLIEKYPNHEEVRTHLSHLMPQKETETSPSGRVLDLKSSCSGKSTKYARTKLPKIKEEVSVELNWVKIEFELAEESKPEPEELLVISLNS